MRLVASLLVATVLAGCGAATPGTPSQPGPVVGSTIGLPTASGANPDEPAIGLTFQMAQAVAQLRTARYVAETFSRGKVGKAPKGVKVNPDGTWQGTSLATEVFKAPASYGVVYTADDDKSWVGTKLAISGSAITMSYTGIWGLLPNSHLRPDSPDMLDYRGQRRDATDFAGIAARLGGAALAQTGENETWADGRTVTHVEIDHAPAGDPEVTREVLELDVQSHLPVGIQRYTAAGLVFQRRLHQFQANAPVTDKDLTP